MARGLRILICDFQFRYYAMILTEDSSFFFFFFLAIFQLLEHIQHKYIAQCWEYKLTNHNILIDS